MPRPSTRSLTSSHLNSSNLFSAAGCRWMMRLAVVATVGGLVASEAGAALYFDVNGTDAGSGAVNGATYTWNSASNALWNTDSGGAGGTLSGFTSGESAVFAAGTDSTGAYAVTVAAHAASPTAAQLGNVAGITVQEGGWTFGGDPIRLTAGSVVEVQSGASATFSGGLRGVAAGTYTFRNNGGTTTNWGQYLRNGAGQTHNVIFEGSGDGTVNLANIGTGSITKNGGGTLAISNRSNQVDQAVTVNGGVLNVTFAGGLTTLNTATALTLNGGTLRTNHDRAIGISDAAHGITLGAGGGTLDQTGATTFTQAGVVTGAGALAKAGTGTLVLSGANDYGGGTTVSAGTLAVDGSIAAGSVSVDINGTLAGIGTIGGPTTVNGTLSPNRANSIGTINFSNTLGLAGTTAVQIDKTPSLLADRVNGTTIALGGTLAVTDLDGNFATYADGDSWNLFDGTLTGSFSSITLPDVSTIGLAWNTSQLSAGGDGTLSLIVPEPASLAVLAMGGLLVGRRRRR